VSVVVATYHRPDVLRCAIESVRRQTIRDWELLVVGDACTDGTADAVAAFGDDRIRFENLGRNVGEQAGPNNVGIARTTAPIVAFLNHDDVWLPTHLERGLEVLDGEGADLAFGAAAAISTQTPLPIRYDSLFTTVLAAGHGGTWSPARVEDVVPASTWLVRRSVLASVGGWRLGRDTWADPSQDLLFRIWRAGHRIRAVGEITVVVTASVRRPASYLRDGAEEQTWVLEHLDDPGFAVELAALAYETDARLAELRRSRGEVLRRIGGRLVAGAGVSPRALHFRLVHGFSRGGYIRFLRGERGLPALTPPRGGAPAMRFAMVQHACRVELPATLSFLAGHGGGRHLAHGWSRPEAHGVWSDGPSADLLFDVGAAHRGRALRLQLELQPWLPEPARRSIVSVEVEIVGQEPGVRWDVSDASPFHDLVVTPDGSRTGLVHVRFHLPRLPTPKDVGYADDPRELAVRLVRGSLRPED
jgi:glycosyltransferase involved in cell wall biosynthesis